MAEGLSKKLSLFHNIAKDLISESKKLFEDSIGKMKEKYIEIVNKEIELTMTKN